jgi:hypothetical protein
VAEIPSVYAPATISTNYYQAPDNSAMMMNALDNYNKQYEINENKLMRVVEKRNTIIANTPPRDRSLMLKKLEPIDSEIDELERIMKRDPNEFMRSRPRITALQMELYKIQ